MESVRKWLAIGTTHEAAQPDLLHQRGIGAVLLLSAPPQQPHGQSLCLTVHEEQVILPHTIEQGIDFVHEQRNMGQRILIADEIGTSRAPAFAIAALKDRGKLNLVDAYRAVLKTNPQAAPHPLHWESLCAFFRDEPSFDVLGYHITMLMHRYTT
ncbi:MAG: dual specificity protein phosphatase [Chloroflexota bacterium]